jgi:hypothetical protein
MAYTLEEIEQAQEPSFEAPIPGASLTTELGSRPWEQPPQYTTVMEAADFYLQGLFSSDGVDSIISSVELGDSAIDIVEKLTMSGASQGLHSVDVGVLVGPILVEAVKTVADFTDIDISTGDEDDEERFSQGMSAVLQKRMSEKAASSGGSLPFEMEDFEMSDEEIAEFETPDEEAVVEDTPSAGLMSRRV